MTYIDNKMLEVAKSFFIFKVNQETRRRCEPSFYKGYLAKQNLYYVDICSQGLYAKIKLNKIGFKSLFEHLL